MNKTIGTNRTEKVNKMNDKKLYKLCKKFGAMALTARRKFAGLLPEVLKRKLYEKKGFSSIYEFAARLAGMSREQVDLVIRLERKFSDKPLLREALVEGKISVNKLSRITSIVTDENQEELFETVKTLSNRAVEVFVKDVKRSEENFNSEKGKNLKIFDLNDGENSAEFQDSNGLLKPEFGQKCLHVQTLIIAEDVEKELSEMQEKGIDVNEFLREALRKRKEDIERRKDEIATEIGIKNEILTETVSVSGQTEKKAEQQGISHRASGTNKSQSSLQKTSHTNGKTGDYVNKSMNVENANYISKNRPHVNAKTKKLLREEHGTKCSIPGCTKLAKIIHHTQRFFLTYNNDPHFLAPMCEEHHEIAHKIDLKYAEKTKFDLTTKLI